MSLFTAHQQMSQLPMNDKWRRMESGPSSTYFRENVERAFKNSLYQLNRDSQRGMRATIPNSPVEWIDTFSNDELEKLLIETPSAKIHGKEWADVNELGLVLAKKYRLRYNMRKYGSIAMATLLVGFGIKSGIDSEIKEAAEMKKIIASKQVECDRILQSSCPVAYDNVYMQVRPLIPGEIPQSGTSMNALYIRKTSQGTCEAVDNQLHLTQRFKEGKNYVTRTVGSQKLLDPILPYSPQMKKCVTDWKG